MVEKKKTLMVVGASALAAAGCGSTDPLDRESTPLALEEARFLSATQVQLTFTRNLAAVDAVSPQKFVLTQAISVDWYVYDDLGDYYAGNYGTYYDSLEHASGFLFDYANVSNLYLGQPSSQVVDALYAEMISDMDPGALPIQVAALERVSGHANQVVLTLSRAVPATVMDTACGNRFELLACESYFYSALEMEYYARYGFTDFYAVSCNGGFMVHFDAAGIPNVETRKGDQTLATIGGALFDPPTPNGPSVLDPTRKILCPL